jgi:chemotaxis response regulator CheB
LTGDQTLHQRFSLFVDNLVASRLKGAGNDGASLIQHLNEKGGVQIPEFDGNFNNLRHGLANLT